MYPWAETCCLLSPHHQNELLFWFVQRLPCKRRCSYWSRTGCIPRPMWCLGRKLWDLCFSWDLWGRGRVSRRSLRADGITPRLLMYITSAVYWQRCKYPAFSCTQRCIYSAHAAYYLRHAAYNLRAHHTPAVYVQRPRSVYAVYCVRYAGIIHITLRSICVTWYAACECVYMHIIYVHTCTCQARAIDI